MDELRERVSELEIRFMHQARQVDELNEELVRSNRRIERLEGENRQLRQMLQTFAPDSTPSPDE
jgi:SlyX protein